MKKLIALSTLIVAGASFAQTTSTTDVDVSQKSIADRMSYSWYAEAVDTVAGSATEETSKDVSMYNSVSFKFDLTNDVKFNFNPRFTIQDSSKDQLAENDLRLQVMGNIFSKDVYTILAFLPITSKTSINKDSSDGQIRIYNHVVTKFDDMNTLITGADVRRTLVKNTDGPHSELQILPWLSYTNKKLSEKFAFRADYEGHLIHNAGKALNNITHDTDTTGERILLGSDISNVAGIDSIYPYLAHYTNGVKALDQAGLGVQVFKAF